MDGLIKVAQEAESLLRVHLHYGDPDARIEIARKSAWKMAEKLRKAIEKAKLAKKSRRV